MSNVLKVSRRGLNKRVLCQMFHGGGVGKCLMCQMFH